MNEFSLSHSLTMLSLADVCRSFDCSSPCLAFGQLLDGRPRRGHGRPRADATTETDGPAGRPAQVLRRPRHQRPGMVSVGLDTVTFWVVWWVLDRTHWLVVVILLVA